VGFEDFAEAGEHVAKAGLSSRGGFGEGHAASAAAGSCSDIVRFKKNDGLIWREPTEPRSGREAGKTSADDHVVGDVREISR